MQEGPQHEIDQVPTEGDENRCGPHSTTTSGNVERRTANVLLGLGHFSILHACMWKRVECV